MNAAGIQLQRKILHTAVTADLLWRLPQGAIEFLYMADLPPGANRGPLAWLGKFLDEYRENAARQEKPGFEGMDELIARGIKDLPEGMKQGIEGEWQIVRGLSVSDPHWVMVQAIQWHRHRKLSEALLRSAGIIGPDAWDVDKFKEAAGLMHRALRDAGSEDSKQLRRLIGEGVRRWQDEELGGQPTGLHFLDQIITGVKPGEVFYVLAPPKGNKTLTLMQIALNGVRRCYSGIWFSYEMRMKPMLLRADRNLAFATKRDLYNGEWTHRAIDYQTGAIIAERPGSLRRTFQALHAARVGELWVQECSPKSKGGAGEAERLIDELRSQGEQIDFVVFDYLNIMSPETREKEKRHELASISRELSKLAKDAEVAVWSAALVNRKAVSKERIRKDDIAESFEVIAVADGAIAVCGSKKMTDRAHWLMYLAALRDAEDERDAGVYLIDRDRMTIIPRFPTLTQYKQEFPQDYPQEAMAGAEDAEGTS